MRKRSGRLAAMATHPDVGEIAPDFTLPSTQGEITLSKRLADGAVLLVFYPGDDTPVCTKQLCDYRDNLAVFADLGVQVVALNPQSMASHEKFVKQARPALPDRRGRRWAGLQALRRGGPLRHDEACARARRPRRQGRVAQDRLPDLLRERGRDPRRDRRAAALRRVAP